MNEKWKLLAAIPGLTVADCILYFDSQATEEEREMAELVETEDESFERDNFIISDGGDNGCYVLGWRWASFSGTKFDKEVI